MKTINLLILILSLLIVGCDSVDQKYFDIIELNDKKYFDISERNLVGLLNLNERQLASLLGDLDFEERESSGSKSEKTSKTFFFKADQVSSSGVFQSIELKSTPAKSKVLTIFWHALNNENRIDDFKNNFQKENIIKKGSFRNEYDTFVFEVNKKQYLAKINDSGLGKSISVTFLRFKSTYF